MDLTQFGSRPIPANPTQPASSQPVGTGENLRVPQSPEAQEFRSRHWTVDKFVDDGQIKAGETDAAQEEFLKHTTFVK